jgi:hypothetical protein
LLGICQKLIDVAVRTVELGEKQRSKAESRSGPAGISKRHRTSPEKTGRFLTLAEPVCQLRK